MWAAPAPVSSPLFTKQLSLTRQVSAPPGRLRQPLWPAWMPVGGAPVALQVYPCPLESQPVHCSGPPAPPGLALNPGRSDERAET